MKSVTINSKQTSSKNSRRHLWVSVVLLLLLLLTTIGITYAIFQFQKSGTKQQTFKTGTLILTLNETSEGISVQNAVPQSDEVGSVSTPYTFTIQNTGTLSAQYRVKLIDDMDLIQQDGDTNRLLGHNKIKYQLVKNEVTGTTALLSTLDESGMILDFGVLAPEAKNTYQLRLWVDSASGNEVVGKHYHGKVVIEAVQNNGETAFDDYVETNMVLWYDGTNHGPDPGVWKDLTGNGNDALITRLQDNHWTTNGLVMPATMPGVVLQNNEFVGITDFSIEVSGIFEGNTLTEDVAYGYPRILSTNGRYLSTYQGINGIDLTITNAQTMIHGFVSDGDTTHSTNYQVGNIGKVTIGLTWKESDKKLSVYRDGQLLKEYTLPISHINVQKLCLGESRVKTVGAYTYYAVRVYTRLSQT